MDVRTMALEYQEQVKHIVLNEHLFVRLTMKGQSRVSEIPWRQVTVRPVRKSPPGEKPSFIEIKLRQMGANHSLLMILTRNCSLRWINPTHFCKRQALWMNRGKFDLACGGNFLRSMSFSSCFSILVNLNVLRKHLNTKRQ
jgi:hypothetical protein